MAWTAVAGLLGAERAGRRPPPAGWPRLSEVASTLYLAGLALVSLTAWRLPAGASGSILGDLSLMLLLSLGSVLAVATLARTEPGELPAPAAGTAEACGELMAQLSHQLRTPLNAVIGFSELMACELYGPLGNRRYQEYAHHICESGGRLLKSSEDALAVTEAMAQWMTDRTRAHRERLALGALLAEAWTAAMGSDARLPLTDGAGHSITGERGAIVQALTQLLRQAASLPGTDAITIAISRRHPSCRLEICAVGARATPPADGADLNLILARLLMQTQGAVLTVGPSDSGWMAAVDFVDG